MSLVTILLNKDKIKKKISNNVKLYDNTSLRTQLDELMKECLITQYYLLSHHLAKNSLNKRNYDDKLYGDDLLFNYYTHQYKHNNIALNDECLEIISANEKYIEFLSNKELKNTLTKKEYQDKLNNKIFLILEEIIDVLHFILQYNILLEEHMHLSLLDDDIRKDITQKSLLKYITNNTKYNDILIKTLEVEAAHINTYILNEMYEKKYEDVGVNDFFNDKIFNIFRLNQEFIRLTAFKDWKNYEKTYYNPTKFTELFNINRNMYINIIELLTAFISKDYVIDKINELIDFEHYTKDININYEKYPKEYNISLIMILVNAIYMSKNEENVRRQLEDPRYTGKKEGKVFGILA